MFGSNPFGQSTSSPFGSQPAFGQTNTATSNPFAPKPFGSTSPFSSQTGSIFGSTSALGSSSAFGSPTPAFSAQSASAFGSSSTASGGSSLFGQKPAFGGFGTSTTQASPFGGSFQQSQPAFGSSVFGSSSPFGAPSQPSFGSMSTPAFGTSTPAFGSSASPVFGSTTGGFGLSTPFGTSTPAFGTTSTPAFGATSSPSFGSAPAFGSTSIPLFGSSSSPAFGTTGGLGFGTATASSFNVSSSPAFGQSTAAFGSSPFGATSAFGAQTTSFGTQTTSPGFGIFSQSTFGVQRGGSRVTPYTQVAETDGTSGSQTTGKLLSISAMPAYKEKSHEELRWEDYQLGDKGGQAPASQPTGFSSPGFVSTSPAFAQSSSNLFSSSSSNPFAPKTPTFSTSSFAPTTTSQFSPSPFPTSNVFSSTASASTPLFSTATQSGGLSTSLFNTSSTSGFAQQSIFGTPSAPGSTPTGLNFASTQSSPLFQSTTQSPLQISSPFSQTPAFSQTSSWMSQPSLFSAPSTGFSNLFSNTSSLFSQPTTSLSTPFQSAQPSQTSLGFNGLAQSGGFPGMFSNVPTGQLPSNIQGAVVSQVAPVTNPFGTLPAMPQMSIGRSGVSPSIQYGISNMPVVDKPAPVRISSLLTSRHFPQRRLRLPVRKYSPKTSGPKVPFFSDDEETPSTPKADAFFVPRENPRALVIPPIDLWPPRSADKIKAVPHEFENGKSLPHDNKTNGKDDISPEPKDNGQAKEQFTSSSGKQKSGGVPSTDQRKTRAGESEPGSDIKSLLPKLSHSDYYTEPGIQELAAKERAEPGFCSHVKNFVVGRKGYGSIKFFDETDVRGLDLESIVQFNDREVLVYMDDSRKPPVGQGLNKPAEITLLNIRFIVKKTGQACTEGPRIDKCKAFLRKKAKDQGAEFVSFDPAKSEWKFRVNHFSSYRFEDDA